MTLVQSIEKSLNDLRTNAAIPTSLTALNSMINKVLNLGVNATAEAWTARVELHSLIVDFDYTNVQYSEAQLLQRELGLV